MDRKNFMIGNVHLVYRQGEPYFQYERGFFAKTVEIGFKKNNTSEESRYVLTLMKSNDVWVVIPQEPNIQYERIGLVRRKDFQDMAKRINHAIRFRQEYDLGTEIENWRIFEETSFCTISINPDLQNIVPISSNSLILTYQNGQPIFYQHGEIGRRVGIYFGQCWFDDHNRPVAIFSIEMNLGETGWYVVARKPDINDWCGWYETYWLDGSDESASRFSSVVAQHFLEQETKVAEIVEKCNRAIGKGESYDFEEYVEFWRTWDKYFSISVVRNSLFVE